MKYFFDTEFLEGKQERPLMLKGRLGNWMIGYPKPTIDLISIGIVAEDGREYSSISKDFNLKEAWNRHDVVIDQMFGDLRNKYPNGRKREIYWLRDNVLKPIWREMFLMQEYDYALLNNREADRFEKELKDGQLDHLFTFRSFKGLLAKFGKSNKQISEEIKRFCQDEVVVFKQGDKLVGAVDPVRGNPEFYAYYADYDWVVFCWLFGKMLDLPKGFPMYCRDLKQMLDAAVDRINLMRFDDNSPKVTVDSMKKNNPFWPKQENEHTALPDARWNKNLYLFLNNLFP